MEITCLVSAITFFLGNLIQMSVQRAKLTIMQNHWDKPTFRALDGEYLWKWWYHRRKLAEWDICAGFFMAMAWVFLAIPIVQIAYAESKGGKRKLWIHVTMACLAIIGCTTEFLTRLLEIGVWNSSNWIATNFEMKDWTEDGNRDFTGYRVLEIIYQVVSGTYLWMDAIEYLALFGIFLLNFMSIKALAPDQRHPLIYALSLALAFFCLLDGVFLLLRLQNWQLFTFIGYVFTAVNRLILIPLWLVIMAHWLPTALTLFVGEIPSLELKEGDAEGVFN